MKRLCACGCGQEIKIKKHHKWYGIPKYISGHNGNLLNPSKEILEKRSKSLKEAWKRPGFREKRSEEMKGEKNPFYGKHHTPETIENMTGKNNANYGKHPSQKTIEKMSKASSGKNNPMYGVPSPMSGKHHTPEIIKKMSGKNHPLYGKHIPKKQKQNQIKKVNEYWSKPGKREEMSKIKKKFFQEHPEARKNSGNFKKGDVPWIKDKNHTLKTRKKLSANQQGVPLNQWKEFISFKPYTTDFNKIFKKRIRKRDNYCCVLCNKPQEELKRLLDIHHTDYNKLNSFPQNCVSLCRGCHLQTNKNRKAWVVFFQKLLKERYGYQYTQDQKIILDFNK